MANLRYEESHRIGKWDLMALMTAVAVAGLLVMAQMLRSGHTERSILLPLALAIQVLAGVVYYLYTLRLVARYTDKNIKLCMMPVGTVKRKIKWDDVLETEIVAAPRESKVNQWASQLSGLSTVVTPSTEACLHLKLKNNEEITIGCQDPEALQQIVDRIRNKVQG
jgi:hypothetical protein